MNCTCELDEQHDTAQHSELLADVGFLWRDVILVQCVTILLQDARHMVRGCAADRVQIQQMS